MKEVSCILLDPLFNALEKKNLSPEILCAGVPYDMAYLRDKNERIEWDVFCRITSCPRPSASRETISASH